MLKLLSLIKLIALVGVLGLTHFFSPLITPFFNQKIKHSTKVIHPAISLTDSVACDLVELQNAEGETLEFYMEVRSVECKKHYCKVVPVRLFWDKFGYYTRFELADGVQLEKGYAEPFIQKDYDKLQQILANEQSELETMDIDNIVNYQPPEEGEVDGYSGATVLVSNEASVTGAVLTCFTLWHWANGGVKTAIRQVMQSNFSLPSLHALLENKEVRQINFALDQLTQRTAYDPQSVAAVVRFAQNADKSLMKLVLTYLENAPAKVYFNAFTQIFQNGTSEQRNLLLNDLATTTQKAPNGFYEQFSQHISSVQTYREINRLLDILEQQKAFSSSVAYQVLPLLKHDDFIVARRSYWFLENCSLKKSQQKMLRRFEQQFSSKL